MIFSLWEFAFLVLPLVSLELFRLKFGYFDIPIFFIIILVMFFKNLLHIKKKIKLNNFQKTSIMILLLFISLHLINSLRAIDFEVAIKHDIKLISCLLVFVLMTFYFPTSKREFLFNLTIMSSTVLLAVYIYHYFFELRAPYLSIEWNNLTEHGKNQLGFYLAVIFPFVYWKGIFEKFSILNIISVLTHAIAIFYSLSRGTWSSVFLGFIISLLLFFFKKKYNKERPVNIYAKIIFMVVIITVLAYYSYYLAPYKDIFQARLHSLLLLEDYAGRRSITMRKGFVENSIIFFNENPIVGIGTTNFYARTQYVNHNDYLQILCEQGIIGLTVFIFFIFIEFIIAISIKSFSWGYMALFNSMINIIIYLLFVNAYNVLLPYIIFAISLKIQNEN
jgi:O-antigen ligase